MNLSPACSADFVNVELLIVFVNSLKFFEAM